MVEDEGVEIYIHKVNDIANFIGDFSGYFEEADVIRKFLLTLPRSYKPKNYAIEEVHDIDKYSID